MATPASVSGPDDEVMWQHQAACRDVDTNVFFPVGTVGMTEYDAAVREAKRVCAWCPVKQECLDYAIRELGVGSANDDLGIYGGMTFAERRSFVRKRRGNARRSHAKKS